MTVPSLRECWDDVHSWRDFWQFIPLLIPRPVLTVAHTIRHPISAYFSRKKEQWIKGLAVGDEVCSCMGHVRIVEFDSEYPDEEFLGDDGHNHSLWNCCSPVRKDGFCHDRDT